MRVIGSSSSNDQRLRVWTVRPNVMLSRRLGIGIGIFAACVCPSLLAQAAAVDVRLDTSAGSIVVAVDTKRAPITARNFLAYVDQKRFDGTYFYRAVRNPGGKDGFVQGGISNDLTRMMKPIPHEPTSRTGIHHHNGSLSMARDEPGTATGDFFIVVGAGQYLDATRNDPGYAAFGQVVQGMATVRRILAAPTAKGGWSQDTKGQSILHPVRITSARRVTE